MFLIGKGTILFMLAYGATAGESNESCSASPDETKGVVWLQHTKKIEKARRELQEPKEDIDDEEDVGESFLSEEVDHPYLCTAAEGMCWYPCNLLSQQDCDGCNKLMCPHEETPDEDPGEEQKQIKAPAECLYRGGMLGQINGLHGSRLDCQNMVSVGHGVSKEQCLIDGQAHNPSHIAYNAVTQECRAVPRDETCIPRAGKNDYHYFDCDHRCSFANPATCIFVDDQGIVTGMKEDGKKPGPEARGVSADMCLLICENVAESNGRPGDGCCAWNQNQNNCRFFQSSEGNTGTLKHGGNKNKWAVELSTCPP